MNDYLRHYEKRNGFTKIASLGDGDLKLTEFGIISLEKGGSYAAASGAFASTCKAWMSVCIISPSAAYTARWQASGVRPAKALLTILTAKCPRPSRAPACPACR